MIIWVLPVTNPVVVLAYLLLSWRWNLLAFLARRLQHWSTINKFFSYSSHTSIYTVCTGTFMYHIPVHGEYFNTLFVFPVVVSRQVVSCWGKWSRTYWRSLTARSSCLAQRKASLTWKADPEICPTSALTCPTKAPMLCWQQRRVTRSGWTSCRLNHQVSTCNLIDTIHVHTRYC